MVDNKYNDVDTPCVAFVIEYNSDPEACQHRAQHSTKERVIDQRGGEQGLEHREEC